MCPVVGGDVDPILRAHVEHSRPVRVLPDDVEVAEGRAGDPRVDTVPAPSEVGRLVEVRLVVAEHVAVDGGVRRGDVEVGRLDAADLPVRRQVGKVGRHVFPGVPAVAGDVDEAVVAPGPDHPLLNGGLGDRPERAPDEGTDDVVDHPAGLHLPRLVVLREVGAQLAPALAAVAGDVDELAPDVDQGGIVGRDRDRKGPVPAVLEVRGRPAVLGLGPDPHAPGLHGGQVEAFQGSVEGARPHDPVGRGVRNRVAALPPAHRVPEGEGDAPSGPAVARTPVGGAVLAIGVDVVGDGVVRVHVVHLGDRQPDPLPRLSSVEAEAGASVVGHQDPGRIRGVDPEAVGVEEAAREGSSRRIFDEALPPVDRHLQSNRLEVDSVLVVGGHRDVGVVERTVRHLLAPVDQRPRPTTIVGPIERRRDVLHQERVHPGGGAGDGDGALSDRVRRHPASPDLRPGVSSVAGHEDPAAGAAAGQVPRPDRELPHPRDQRLRIVGIDREIRASRLPVHGQDPLPGVAPVGGPIDAPLLLGLPATAQGAGVDHVGVPRVDHDLTDPPRALQPHVSPRLTPIRGLPHAVPDRQPFPDDEGLARPGPHLVRCRGCHRQRVDGGDVRIVEDRLPAVASVHRPPDAPGRGTDVRHQGISRLAHRGVRPIPLRPDVPVADRAVEVGGEILGAQGGQGDREGQGEERGHGAPRWTDAAPRRRRGGYGTSLGCRGHGRARVCGFAASAGRKTRGAQRPSRSRSAVTPSRDQSVPSTSPWKRRCCSSTRCRRLRKRS